MFPGMAPSRCTAALAVELMRTSPSSSSGRIIVNERRCDVHASWALVWSGSRPRAFFLGPLGPNRGDSIFSLNCWHLIHSCGQIHPSATSTNCCCRHKPSAAVATSKNVPVISIHKELRLFWWDVMDVH